MSNAKVKRYKMVDLFRLVCAFMVVLIHMGFGENAAFIPCVTRQAVPFFFLISGFFFAKRDWSADDSLRAAIKYALVIVLVYAVWITFWLPIIISDSCQSNQGQPFLFIALVVFRRVILAGIAPYWYLLALAEGSVVLALVLRYKKYWLGWILCIGGIALSVVYCLDIEAGLGGLIHRVFYTAFSWENNFIMTGFPLLFLGAEFSRYESRLKTWHRSIAALLYFAAIILAFIVFASDKKLYGIPFGIIQGLMLFMFCIAPSRADSCISDGVCDFSRNLSSVIFLTHTVFLTLLGNILHVWDPYVRFAITIACAVVVLLFAALVNNKILNELLMIKLPSGKGKRVKDSLKASKP